MHRVHTYPCIQESFFGEQLMNSLGVARILSEAEGSGPRWGGTMGIEPFVPKGHVRHYEGELLRKHMVSMYRRPLLGGVVGTLAC